MRSPITACSFKDCERHGRGVLVQTRGSLPWSSTQLYGSGPLPYQYRGQWRRGVPHGRGACRYPDGSCYMGQWVEGVWHGQGEWWERCPPGVGDSDDEEEDEEQDYNSMGDEGGEERTTGVGRVGAGAGQEAGKGGGGGGGGCRGWAAGGDGGRRDSGGGSWYAGQWRHGKRHGQGEGAPVAQLVYRNGVCCTICWWWHVPSQVVCGRSTRPLLQQGSTATNLRQPVLKRAHSAWQGHAAAIRA